MQDHALLNRKKGLLDVGGESSLSTSHGTPLHAIAPLWGAQ